MRKGLLMAGYRYVVGRAFVVIAFAAALAACGGSDAHNAADSGPAKIDVGAAAHVCQAADDTTRISVVTDIDETLTTLDAEYIMQIGDPSYDPKMRPDANTLMSDLAGLGYAIQYVTARGTDLPLSDGTTSTDATTNWLNEHQYPRFANDLHLYQGTFVTGDATRDYKIGVLMDLISQGYSFTYAFGNAQTDIEAYQAVGIPDDHIYLVGVLAGQLGVQPITDADAYTSFITTFIPTVPCAN